MKGGFAGRFDVRAARVELASPLSSVDCDEGVCLLDGCIDDVEDLREELGPGAAGLPVERLLALGHQHWGAELLSRLRGDFALLVWNGERGEGLLARDQLGVRSIFLHGSLGGELRFATEIAPLLRLLPTRPGPDQATLAHWLVGSTRHDEATLYAGVRKLPAGSALALSRGNLRQIRYWRPRYRSPLDLAPAALAARVRTGLERSVSRRASAAPTALLMSGGLDSAAIAAIAAKEPGGPPLLACSATFPDHPQADESGLIAALGEQLGLDSIVARVRPGGLLTRSLAYLDAWEVPQLGWGDFWAVALMRAAAARGAATVLGGTGGDELFGPRSYLLADRLRAGHPREALRLAGRLPGAGPWVKRREVAGVFGRLAVAGALPAWAGGPRPGRRTAREAPAWLAPTTRRALAESDDPEAWKRLDGPRWWARATHDAVVTIEASGAYDHQRRRAASLGLESRHPMLDLDLVELALRQPPEATLDPRYNRPVLRAAVEGLLPDSVRLRPGKAWFQSVIADSLAASDGATVRALLTDPGAELGAHLDLARMEDALFSSPATRERDPFRWMAQVWRLLTAECWLRSQSRSGSQILPPESEPSQVAIKIDQSIHSDLFQP